MIKIKGVIIANKDKWIYDLIEMDSTSPADVEKQILSDTDRIVEINSPGGYVVEGSEIYSMLQGKGYEVLITGQACSAASVIAMAGDKVKIAPTAQIMIHNAAGGIFGDYNAMDHASYVLKQTNKTIANAYIIKTGMAQDELLELMNKESWFTPQEALEMGFVDEIVGMESERLTNAVGVIPEKIVNQMQAEKMQAKLKLLKLRRK